MFRTNRIPPSSRSIFHPRDYISAKKSNLKNSISFFLIHFELYVQVYVSLPECRTQLYYIGSCYSLGKSANVHVSENDIYEEVQKILNSVNSYYHSVQLISIFPFILWNPKDEIKTTDKL
jgi:hypothetical protein